MKYQIERTTQFKKDYKLAAKRGRNLEKLKEIIMLLANGKGLPPECRDHELVNSKKYKGIRECHIEPDWLLAYKISEDVLVLLLYRTGTHSDLF